jgi:hypothetical protein
VVLPSDNSEYEFLVVAAWYSNFTVNFGTGDVVNDGNQTSLTY